MGGNGTLPLDFGLRGAGFSLDVVGGPYDNFRGGNAFGVCVRKETTRAPVHAHLPITDFSVPPSVARTEAVLLQAFRAALDGKQLYVGCMGGWGRTGLFLALMAKVAGIPHPVEYVRDNYTPRAVETPEQYDYVSRFDVSFVRRQVLNQAWRKRVPLIGGLIARFMA